MHAGVLRCIVWAVEDKTEQHAACVASYVITIAWDRGSGSAAVRSVELLRRSKLPPHAVRVPSFNLTPTPDHMLRFETVEPALMHAFEGSHRLVCRWWCRLRTT